MTNIFSEYVAMSLAVLFLAPVPVTGSILQLYLHLRVLIKKKTVPRKPEPNLLFMISRNRTIGFIPTLFLGVGIGL
jgi:hypothetical protein